MVTYRPAPVPDDIAEALGARAERLGAFLSRLLYFETVSSTNDIADRLAADGARHGTVVVAEAQESGRGRMGRTWFSPPGAGLYVSVVLRPEALEGAASDSHEAECDGARSSLALASSVSLTAGVALAEAVRAASGLPVSIKWPNDLVIERRKLCGILAEACSAPQRGEQAEARPGPLQHIILGYGINIRPAAYPPEIADRATSLEGELGRAIDRGEVLAESLACLAEWLPRTAQRGLAAMLERWRQLSPSSTGAPVEVVQPGGGWAAGTTAGIDADGALLVLVGGFVRRVIAGEVRWL